MQQTYAYGYHFATTHDHKDALYVFSYEFEKVECSSPQLLFLDF